MKKLFLFVIALIAFAVGCLAVEYSPPIETEKQGFAQASEKYSAGIVNFVERQDVKIIPNKPDISQREKVILSKTLPTVSAFNCVKTEKHLIPPKLPPNQQNNRNGFDGNVTNQIRADPA